MIYGSRHIMCKVPVRTPSDLKGVKIRVPNSDLSISMMEAMGGVGTPMSLSEVYASIQQGVIDGMENPIATHLQLPVPDRPPDHHLLVRDVCRCVQFSERSGPKLLDGFR